MTDKPIPELRALIRTEQQSWGGRDGEYLRVTVELVVQMEDGRVRNLKVTYPNEPHYGLAELEITAQMDGGKRFDGRWYGFRPEFRPHSVDLERAVAMALTLKRIEARMTRLNERFGSAPDFETWLLRVADILKIRRFGILIGRRGAGHSYDDHEYDWLDAQGIRYCLTNQTREYGAKFRPAEEVPA